MKSRGLFSLTAVLAATPATLYFPPNASGYAYPMPQPRPLKGWRKLIGRKTWK